MKTNTQLLKTIQMLIQLELDKTENKKEKVLSEGNFHLIDDGTTLTVEQLNLNSKPSTSKKKKQIENRISKMKSVYKEGMTIKQLSEKTGIEINFVNNHWTKIEPRPAK